MLRAEFDLVLARSLPVIVAESMTGEPEPKASDPQLLRQRVVVDLFKPSDLARHAAEAHALAETGISLVKVGEALGISKRQAHLCSLLGAKMAEAGLTDPFIRLTERPEKVSRWRSQRQPPNEGGQREAG